jgi:hypothetical protein
MFAMFQKLLSCINAVFATSMPQGVNANDLARTVYSGIPDDVIFISASAAGRAFILTGSYNKMSSSETESTASDMSDLSYEQELAEVGEGGEVDEGPLQHCRKLTT